VSNSTAHTTWTGRAACDCNGQAQVLSIINAKTRVAQRLYARLRPLAYATCIRPHGSIGSLPRRGSGVSVIVRIPPDQVWTRVGTGRPPRSCLRPGYALSWNPRTPLWAARTPHRGVWIPFQGSGSHTWRSEVLDQTWRSGPYIQGSDTFPWGSRFTGDASEYVTFSGHVAAPDPPMWWDQVLLLAQSSRPRLGRVMAWSHIHLFYHATKNSRVGTAFIQQ
jgi:hypothetical protein